MAACVVGILELRDTCKTRREARGKQERSGERENGEERQKAKRKLCDSLTSIIFLYVLALRSSIFFFFLSPSRLRRLRL